MENTISRPKNILDIKSFAAFIIFTVMFFITNSVITEIAKQNTSIEGWVLIAIQLVTYVVFLVVMFTTLLKNVALRITDTIKSHPKEVFKVAFKAMVIYLLLSIAVNATAKVIIESLTDRVVGSSDNQSAINQIFKGAPIGAAIMSVLVLFIGPVTEEVAFRQGLLSSAMFNDNKWFKRGVTALSIFLFGAMHVVFGGDWQNITPYLLMACVVTYVYYKHNGNLTYTIATHMLINISATLMGLTQ